MKRIFLPLALVIIATVAISWQQEMTSKQLVSNMLTEINKLKSLQYELKSWERMKDGHTQFSQAFTKLRTKPFQLYILSKAEPNEGVEILYNQSLFGEKVAVNPGAWLPNVKMDPFSNRMRKGQHHAVMNSGFHFLHGVVSKAVARAEKEAGDKFTEVFKYDGDVTWEGKACYKLVIEDPTFKYVDYTVKEGETIQSIADRDAICGYLLIDKNPGVNDFDELKAGMVIKKPTSYAKKTVIYLDKSNSLPIVQIMFDDKGQFEKYEFHDLVVNPTFKDIEFTKDFDGYDF